MHNIIFIDTLLVKIVYNNPIFVHESGFVSILNLEKLLLIFSIIRNF